MLRHGSRIGIPTDGLVRLGLGQRFQEANAVVVAIEAVQVIKNDRPVLVMPELAVQTEGGGVAFQPAGGGI